MRSSIFMEVCMNIVNKLPFDKFEIWQIDDGSERSPYKFMGYSLLKKHNISPLRRDYIKVYEADLGEMDLEDIFVLLNTTRPEGFVGHSLSVSDIVVLKATDTGTESAFYVDSVGFQKLPF